MLVRTTMAALVLAVPLLAGCGPSADEDPLVARGRTVYLNNCTACHARDPNEKGPVGPAVAGSSEELLHARVVRNEYPPGYEPKQKTGAMIALPHLEPDVPALAAFLAEAARP